MTALAKPPVFSGNGGPDDQFPVTSGSYDREPSNVSISPGRAVLFGPASAFGGTLANGRGETARSHRDGRRGRATSSPTQTRLPNWLVEIDVISDYLIAAPTARIFSWRSLNVFRIPPFEPTLAATYAFPSTANARLAASGVVELVLFEDVEPEAGLPRETKA